MTRNRKSIKSLFSYLFVKWIDIHFIYSIQFCCHNVIYLDEVFVIEVEISKLFELCL